MSSGPWSALRGTLFRGSLLRAQLIAGFREVSPPHFHIGNIYARLTTLFYCMNKPLLHIQNLCLLSNFSHISNVTPHLVSSLCTRTDFVFAFIYSSLCPTHMPLHTGSGHSACGTWEVIAYTAPTHAITNQQARTWYAILRSRSPSSLFARFFVPLSTFVSAEGSVRPVVRSTLARVVFPDQCFSILYYSSSVTSLSDCTEAVASVHMAPHP